MNDNVKLYCNSHLEMNEKYKVFLPLTVHLFHLESNCTVIHKVSIMRRYLSQPFNHYSVGTLFIQSLLINFIENKV